MCFFQKYLFPKYPELARQFYKYMHRTGKCKNKHIPTSTFRQQCERILATLDDAAVIETYVRMFGAETDENMVTATGFRALLLTSYRLAMDHYPEGPQTCLLINKTLSAVVNGCFNNKEIHSVGFVVRWLEEHYTACTLWRRRHREVSAEFAKSGSGNGGEAGGGGDGEGGEGASGVELATPVLELRREAPRLPLSVAWLLASAWSCDLRGDVAGGYSGGVLASAAWLARLVSVPGHWTPLYWSHGHGLGANRFLHHTTAYRPYLSIKTMIGRMNKLALMSLYCSPPGARRWWCWSRPRRGWWWRARRSGARRTSTGAGPTARCCSWRPRSRWDCAWAPTLGGPLLAVPEDFDTFTFLGAPYPLHAIQVWGCGDTASRETQLEIKKWQIKEVEKQRQVKLSAAEWMEHPDRYLLELAGRPQYNNAAQ
ncbi:hypothetical protein ACJJTC_016528 [Scirpophaga incertulas]